jgi:hypothetical protein
MIKKIITIIIIFGLLAGGLWWFLTKEGTDTIVFENQKIETKYSLYSEKDSGAEEYAQMGSVVIVQLPKAMYDESISIVDSTGKSLEVTKEEYNEKIAVSFFVTTSSQIFVTAKNLVPLKRDFVLTINPVPLPQ